MSSTSLLERLKKASKIDGAEVMADSKLFGTKEFTRTEVPMINVALSGSIDGGLTSGLTVLAGPSKHFKTSFGLLMVASYLKQHSDAICMFYDSEFGSPQAYFTSFGIDTSRVLHTPITNIEELKFDLVSQLQNINRGDKVIIMIDSIGNLASKKEIEDAINEKSVADMTRAKALKGLFRMVTPMLSLKDIPLIGIAHIYMTQEMYSKPVISGGTGIVYSADTAWIIGRSQDKDGDEMKGYHFNINVEKSRFVREKSKIPISVSWEGGIERNSGLLDIAVDGGYVLKPQIGWYVAHDPKSKKDLSKKLRADQTFDDSFWNTIYEKTDFKEYVKNRYSMGHKEMLATRKSSGAEDESD
jgi:RecA/RadA recombinase